MFSYIKPQLAIHVVNHAKVVYLCFPTSNRNSNSHKYCGLLLYIFVFLHQTATLLGTSRLHVRCISLFSYIKPQLIKILVFLGMRCISLFSYIKPQLDESVNCNFHVVYLCFPTSNRNSHVLILIFFQLYIFVFLHQTATYLGKNTHHTPLYIFVFLHQTATVFVREVNPNGCISLFSYIKPQPRCSQGCAEGVVYLCFPTSN